MKLKIIKFCLDEECSFRYVEKFRGFMGNKFKEIIEFHNHKDEFTFNYDAFPSIQYRMYGKNKLGILLIDKFSDVDEICKHLTKINTLPLGNRVFSVKKVEIEEQCFNVGIVDDELFTYKFVTPWLALNEKNHKLYKAGELDLDIVLRNNILSLFKGLGITADKIIMSKGIFNERKVILKDTEFIAFEGQFITNVDMPTNFALGKRKSIGYGVIEKVK